MMIDLRKLHHAVLLAEAGHFARAAHRAHLTQSAFSRSIQALEADMGLLLFDRLPGGVVPTADGAMLLERARAMLTQAAGLASDAALLRQGDAGRLRFGVGPMFAPLLAPLLSAVAARPGAVEIRAEVMPLLRMAELVVAGEMDCFIADTTQLSGRADLAIRIIAALPVGYVVRAGHPLATGAAPDPVDLACYPLAAPEFRPFRPDDATWSASALPWAGRFSCEDITALKAITLASDAVMMGMGPGLEPEMTTGALVRLPLPATRDWVSQVGVCSRAGRSGSALMHRLADHAAQLLAGGAAAHS